MTHLLVFWLDKYYIFCQEEHFLKKHTNIYFQDEINCWVPIRWKALWSCSNNKIIITAPLQSKCISFDKESQVQKSLKPVKNTKKKTEIRIDLRVPSHFPRKRVVATFPVSFLHEYFLWKKKLLMRNLVVEAETPPNTRLAAKGSAI